MIHTCVHDMMAASCKGQGLMRLSNVATQNTYHRNNDRTARGWRQKLWEGRTISSHCKAAKMF